METKEFRKLCEGAAYSVLTAWARYINCYSVLGKRQFCIEASHSWGTAYCDWSRHKSALFEALRQVGAVNICGKVGPDYVCVYFDMSKKLIKK